MDLSYILNLLGEHEGTDHGPVSPPIYQTSNFRFRRVELLEEALGDEYSNSLYSRGLNPTVDLLCSKVAALEETEACLAFGSGAAAVSAAVISQVKKGDHVICVEHPYGWTEYLLKEILAGYGVEVSFIDGTNIQNFEKAICHNTRLIILESPNSMFFSLQDVEAVCRLAAPRNITTMIDNSWSSPLCFKPASLGVDLVVHSATKYIGGHSDTVAGLICGKEELIRQIFSREYLCLGAILAPFDAWLLIRGLRTLETRMERIFATTQKVIEFLSGHEKIEKIFYPLHESHPQFELALKQFQKGSGLFSCLLNSADELAIREFCNSLERFQMAVSWGGHESLIFPALVKRNPDYPINLIRFSIGLEAPDVLIADLDQALSNLSI